MALAGQVTLTMGNSVLRHEVYKVGNVHRGSPKGWLYTTTGAWISIGNL